MMEKIRLGDLVNTSSGATPLSSNKEYYENGDIPWINSGEVGQYKINFAEKFITKEGFEKSNTKIFPKDTILVAMYGATAGKTSILNINACTNQAVCAILPSENVNNIFLKYKLDSIYDYLVQISSGSARDNLSQKVIQDLEINLPLLETQQKIAKILSDIDDKIEVLHQINDNLAELAKTIYDYWFVQFDFPDQNGKPYKTSGGKMVYNEVLKREIPKGWEVQKLGEIEPNIITGKTPPTKDENNFNGNILFITIDDIRQNLFIYNSERTLSEKGANTQRAKFLKKGDICVSCIGTVGVIGIVGKIAQTNQQINSISNPQNFNKYFLLNYLDRYFKDNFTAKKGAVLDNMNKAEFESIIIINPIQNIKKIYYGKVKFLYEKIDTNIQQIQHLQSLRDWLLPMLMNGQISVE